MTECTRGLVLGRGGGGAAECGEIGSRVGLECRSRQGGHGGRPRLRQGRCRAASQNGRQYDHRRTWVRRSAHLSSLRSDRTSSRAVLRVQAKREALSHAAMSFFEPTRCASQLLRLTAINKMQLCNARALAGPRSRLSRIPTALRIHANPNESPAPVWRTAADDACSCRGASGCGGQMRVRTRRGGSAPARAKPPAA